MYISSIYFNLYQRSSSQMISLCATYLLCITQNFFFVLDARAVEACLDNEGVACAEYAAKGQCTDVEVSFACAKTCNHCKLHSEKLRESEKVERGELRRRSVGASYFMFSL